MIQGRVSVLGLLLVGGGRGERGGCMLQRASRESEGPIIPCQQFVRGL